jgi:hypothetical protein
MSSWRGQYEEIDKSQFTVINANETGAMVLKSKKGPNKPVKVQADDVLMYFGEPSAEYNEVFELLAFSKVAPCWAVSPIGDGALYGGVDVYADKVVSFGVGRDYDTYDYSVVAREEVKNIGVGDGAEASYSGTLTNTPIINTDNISISVNNVVVDVVSDESGNLTGDAITAGSIDLSTGVYSITFDGTPGTFAEVTTDIDFSSPIDISGSVKSANITIDGVTKTLSFGSTTISRTDAMNIINTAFGKTVVASSGNFMVFTSDRASANGNILIADPTSGDSALDLIFSLSGDSLSDTGATPTGSIPRYNQTVLLTYNYSVDNTDISHSFFTFAPYEDDLSMVVISKGGSKFQATLYQKIENTGYVTLMTYNYSLIKEKDGFGTSLYYEDVFDDDPYVQIKVNSNFIAEDFNLISTTKVDFSGGYRGAEPETSDYITAWNYFNYANKYPAKIFMDVKGNAQITLNSIIQTYQPWAQAISVIPRGNDATEAIQFRSDLGLDSDDVCLYTNWARIEDTFNDSSAWLSLIGSVGKKYALMYDTYDSLSPAGIDENNHGGQLNDWKVLEMENEYTDNATGSGELQLLDQSQINPIIKDEVYGVMCYGDRTLQVTNSDTSFVGTRRVYKLIADAVQKQVLRLQEFKNNDNAHRQSARIRTLSILTPILGGGWIREASVVCDRSNNTDAVLDAREFIVDIYIKATPNSQRTKLRITRLAQGQTTAEVSAG